jgi:hypothetical protein
VGLLGGDVQRRHEVEAVEVRQWQQAMSFARGEEGFDLRAGAAVGGKGFAGVASRQASPGKP